MHHSLLRWTCCLALAAGFVIGGCSSDDSGSPPATATGGSAGAAGNATGGAAGSTAGSAGSAGNAAGSAGAAGSEADASTDAQEPSDAQPAEASAGLKVKVTYQGSTTEVDINQGELHQNAGTDYSLVSSVILIALPSKAIADLQANFKAGDGYNPADKPNCATFVPVKGDTLKQGWITRSNRDLEWDPALGYPGCVAVNDLAEILVEDKQ